MTREEYVKKNNEDIDKMSIEKLRAYTKRIDANAQVYFRNWQKAESQLKEKDDEILRLKSSVIDHRVLSVMCTHCGEQFENQLMAQGHRCRTSKTK